MFSKIKGVKFFSKGKRGYIYVGLLNNKKVSIKVKNPESKAVNRIKNEAYWLKILNKKGIGPKFLWYKDNILIYKFVEGEFIIDWIIKHNKTQIKRILKLVFLDCRKLDNLNVDKEEMHKPVKHILVKNKPVLIDFERTKKSKKPKNVTQFCQFLLSRNLSKILKEKGFTFNRRNVINLLKKYKKSYSEKEFNLIIKYFLG